MHRLHLLRHAKSGWDDGAEDRERKLNGRGRDEAETVGATLPGAIGPLDLVLCSTARRTRETAALVLRGFTPAPRATFEDWLYLAGAAALVDRLSRLDEVAGSVLVIGHNPGLHEVALALAAPDSPGYAALAGGKFPTAVRASFAVAGTWSSLGRSRHPMTDYVTAKSLKT
ncbi:MAG TPA: histidine phosphatase family protein [Stellaceae bacterium]|jgi:phosphohistidine phosphatase